MFRAPGTFCTDLALTLVDEPDFDPFLHEIVSVEQADDPGSPVEIVESLWPAVMNGELLFSRAGVRVRGGAQHVVAGVADRAPLDDVFLRRHRATVDESLGWGHNSQWKTDFRRNYRTATADHLNVDGEFDLGQPLARVPTDHMIRFTLAHEPGTVQDSELSLPGAAGPEWGRDLITRREPRRPAKSPCLGVASVEPGHDAYAVVTEPSGQSPHDGEDGLPAGAGAQRVTAGHGGSRHRTRVVGRRRSPRPGSRSAGRSGAAGRRSR